MRWKDGELSYLCSLVENGGDDNVGRDPKTIATYLRLQASDAYRAGLLELASHIFMAATAINEDARNNHAPDWARAIDILTLAVRHELTDLTRENH